MVENSWWEKESKEPQSFETVVFKDGRQLNVVAAHILSALSLWFKIFFIVPVSGWWFKLLSVSKLIIDDFLIFGHQVRELQLKRVHDMDCVQLPCGSHLDCRTVGFAFIPGFVSGIIEKVRQAHWYAFILQSNIGIGVDVSNCFSFYRGSRRTTVFWGICSTRVGVRGRILEIRPGKICRTSARAVKVDSTLRQCWPSLRWGKCSSCFFTSLFVCSVRSEDLWVYYHLKCRSRRYLRLRT